MPSLCLDWGADGAVAVNVRMRSNIYFVLPMQLSVEYGMLVRGLQVLPACSPGSWGCRLDLLSCVLLDATNLLRSAQELSRQRCGIFSLADAVCRTYNLPKQVA